MARDTDSLYIFTRHWVAPDGITAISGSRFVPRDLLQTQNWQATQMNAHDLLSPLAPPPRDENGVPMVLCSNGHYMRRDDFARDVSRKSGLQHYCKFCQRTRRDNARRTAKTQVSRVGV